MQLLLIRHGQSNANAEGRLQGHMDSPLNDIGRQQARCLAQRLHDERWMLSAIYTSDLSRAAETAQILADALELCPVPDLRLREYDAGVLTGLTDREIQTLYPEIWRDLQDDSTWTHFPSSEGNRAFQARLAAVLDEILARHSPDAVIAIVSHGGCLGMLLTHLLGMDTTRPWPFCFDNTSVSIAELGPGRRIRLRVLNDTCHLRGA